MGVTPKTLFGAALVLFVLFVSVVVNSYIQIQNSEIDQLNENLRVALDKIQGLEAKIQGLEASLAGLEAANAELSEQNEKLAEEKTRLEKEINDLKQEIERLIEQLKFASCDISLSLKPSAVIAQALSSSQQGIFTYVGAYVTKCSGGWMVTLHTRLINKGEVPIALVDMKYEVSTIVYADRNSPFFDGPFLVNYAQHGIVIPLKDSLALQTFKVGVFQDRPVDIHFRLTINVGVITAQGVSPYVIVIVYP